MTIGHFLRLGIAGTVIAASLGCTPAKPQGPPAKYYIQLVRGNDDETPPTPASERIGPKLSGQLHQVFKWRSYWEINRREELLAVGQRTRVRLSPEREVEIDLTQAGLRTVTAYQNARVVGHTSRPIGMGMTVTGGDRDTNSAWFIVVRRDPPSN